jgi:hypothetical protein
MRKEHLMERIDYNNRIFVSVTNTKNGEVNAETTFHYYQKENYIWAEYSGGIIIKGFLVGYIDENGILHFTYEHINNEKIIRTGKCESTPRMSKDGKIELLEKWEWTNGDKSKGESRIIEKVNENNI